jgi:hypothetical protein
MPKTAKGWIHMAAGFTFLLSGAIMTFASGPAVARSKGEIAGLIVGVGQLAGGVYLLRECFKDIKQGVNAAHLSGFWSVLRMGGGYAALFAGSVMVPVGTAKAAEKQLGEIGTVVFGLAAMAAGAYLLNGSYKELKANSVSEDVERGVGHNASPTQSFELRQPDPVARPT